MANNTQQHVQTQATTVQPPLGPLEQKLQERRQQMIEAEALLAKRPALVGELQQLDRRVVELLGGQPAPATTTVDLTQQARQVNGHQAAKTPAKPQPAKKTTKKAPAKKGGGAKGQQGMTLRQYVTQVLREEGPSTVKQIADHVTKAGYKTSSDNLGNIIGTMINEDMKKATPNFKIHGDRLPRDNVFELVEAKPTAETVQPIAAGTEYAVGSVQ